MPRNQPHTDIRARGRRLVEALQLDPWYEATMESVTDVTRACQDDADTLVRHIRALRAVFDAQHPNMDATRRRDKFADYMMRVGNQLEGEENK